jgi:hypothetical protein
MVVHLHEKACNAMMMGCATVARSPLRDFAGMPVWAGSSSAAFGNGFHVRWMIYVEVVDGHRGGVAPVPADVSAAVALRKSTQILGTASDRRKMNPRVLLQT